MQGVRTTISCNGCKRRKKGCDFKKPSCSRCERLGTTCRYEKRTYTFIDGPKSQSRSRSISPREKTLTSTSHTALLETDTTLQVMEAFWSIYLPAEDGIRGGNVGGLLAAPWIPVVRSLAQEDTYLRHAVIACAFTGLSWWRDNTALLQRGLQSYTYALSKVNKALQVPEEARDDAALACCRVFSLFEMFRRGAVSNTGNSQQVDWRRHAEGTYQLVRLRGRESHIEGYGALLYDGVRMAATIQGLGTRRNNSFTELAWQLPGQGTLRDSLFDLMCIVPGLLEQSDRLKVRCSDRSEEIQDVLQQGIYLLKQFHAIGIALRAWEAEARALCSSYGAGYPSLIEACMDYGYGFFFVCTQYWASCVTLYSSMRMLQTTLVSLQESFGHKQQLPRLQEWINPAPHALHIAEVSSHFFEPQAGLWAAQAAIFPCSTSLMYLARTGQQHTEAYQMTMKAFSHNKAGLIVKDFFHSIMSAS